ncbi:MAG TPA: ABC transporter permease [Bacteroidales bacterium]|nr:ABC transporter permease [Bacteroidales bacterium]
MRNYFFKIALRNILRNRLYSFINIAGLALGITAFMLIMMFVRYERSFDTFHKNSDRIYRLRYERSSSEGESVKFASCCPPAAIRIRELYPEVEAIARLFRYRATVIFGENKFYEERMYFAEPQIFNLFDIEMVTGDPATGIRDANCAFISESYAVKYFGETDPMGQTITVDKEMSFVITGIYRDFPDNSHIDVDIMLSWPNLVTHYGADIEGSWGDTGFFTYFILNPSVSPADFEEKLKALVESDFGEVLRYYKLTLDLKVQPLKEIHLNSAYMQEIKANGNHNTIVFLSIIAFFILIIAWVNYINITTARSLTRAMEVGLSKVAGAARPQLIKQFFTETILINVFAFLLSILLIILTLSSFCRFSGISAEYVLWKEGWFWLTLMVLFVCSILFSGTYPVFVLTSFSTSEVLRGKYIHSKRGIIIRKVLVMFQLVMAISLITCTILVFRQVRFLMNQEKGIITSDVLAVRAPRVRDAAFGSRLLTFKEELLKSQTVTRFSVGTEVPGRQILWDAGGIFRVGSDQSKNYQIIGIDYDYLPLLEAQIVAGRNFDRSFSDSASLILNETATRWMGFESPEEAVNQKVNYWDNIYSIAGVVKDYRQQSPKEAFEPHIYRFMPQGRDVRGFFMIKYQPGNETQVLELAEKNFSEFFPDNPFDYFFLEDYYDQQYRDEKLLGSVFGIFALLAIIVTCLGIFGLTSFLMLQKVKEISIRRVVGSNVSGIIMLFSRDFIRITAVSFIIAVPACYYWLMQWLETFEVRMEISVWNFIIPFMITLAMTIITIGLIVSKTASASPANNLKSE